MFAKISNYVVTANPAAWMGAGIALGMILCTVLGLVLFTN